MDLSNIFSNIGNFFGGLFNPSQQKKRPDDQPQPTSQPTQSLPPSLLQQNPSTPQAPGSPQMPAALTIHFQPPQLGGVSAAPQAPQPAQPTQPQQPTVAQPKSLLDQILDNPVVSGLNSVGKGIGDNVAEAFTNPVQEARNLGGGAVDTANFLTRIPETLQLASNELTGNNNQASLQEAGYHALQSKLQDLSNFISGNQSGNANQQTTQEAQAISTGQATPEQVLDAALKSGGAATIAPIGRLLSGVIPEATNALRGGVEADLGGETAAAPKPTTIAPEPTKPNNPITTSVDEGKPAAITSNNQPEIPVTPQEPVVPETPVATAPVEPTVAEQGGVRPANDLQSQIEEAHNSGDQEKAAALIQQLPAELQAPIKDALGIKDDTAPAATPSGPGSTEAQVNSETEVKPNPNAVPNLPDRVKLLSSKLEAIRKTGTDSGNELADRIETADTRHNQLRADYMNGLNQVFKLNDKDFKTAWDVQEGKVDPATVSPKVQAAAEQLKTVMPQIQKDASNANAISGDLGETYMPHVYEKGKGPTVNMPDSVNTSSKKYGNLDTTRTTENQNYLKNKDVLLNYIDKASQRIGQSENFGSKNQVANDLLSKIGAEGGDQGTASKAFANYLRTPFSNTTASKVFNGVRSALGVARLPLAAVSHLGQTTNAAVDSGIGNTLKAWGEHLAGAPEDKAFVDRTGVINPQSLGHYSNNYTSVPGKLANKVTAPGLTGVMKANRSVTALAYRNYANKLAADGNVAELQKLGVNGDIGKTLTDEQQLEAARAGVQKTMFTGSSAHTPINAETTAGRFVGQYRTAYAYPQTKFIYNNILKEAGNGNLAPLTRYLGVGGGVSAATIATKNAISGRQETPGDVATDVAAGLGGLPGEAASSLIRYAPGNPAGTVAGLIAPAAGEAINALNAGGSSIKSGNPTAAERYGLKLIPAVGGRLATALTPTKAQQNAAVGAQPASSGNPITDFINNILHPAPPDALSTEMSRLGSDANVKFTTAETKALNSKDIGPTAHALLDDPIYQAADDQAKATMLKSVLSGSASKGISTSLSDADKQALLDEKLLTNAADKKAWLDDNKNAASYYTAQYDNAVANKSLNPQLDNDLANKNGLAYKAVAAQVDEKYNADPQLKADYASTTQSKFTALLNPKSATYDTDAAQTLYAYDQARVAAGLPPKYNMDVVSKALAKAASTGAGVSKTFAFASLPSSLMGTGSTGTTGSGGYASNAPLFTPIAALQAPQGAAIPKGRTISVVKGK